MQPEKAGTVRTNHLEDNIIETVYDGYISTQMIDEVERKLIELLPQYENPQWLVDTIGATGLAPAKHEARTGIVKLFLEKRGTRIAVVVRQPLIRMVTSTFAYAFFYPISAFERRDDALKFLRSAARVEK